MTTTPTAWNDKQQVNTTDESELGQDQHDAKVIGLAGGGYVIAWEDDSDRTMLGAPDIIGQRYDVFGATVGGEFILSQIYNDFAQVSVELTAFEDGSFAAAYQTTGDPLFGDLENVTVERFGADGIETGFNDFRGPANDLDPAIASFADGGYALVYRNDESGQDDLTFVYVDTEGVASDGVTIEDAAPAVTPEIVALSSGNVAVVYGSSGAGSSSILVSVVTTAGTVLESDLAAQGSSVSDPVVAALANGFVVVWASGDADGAGNGGVLFRLYANDGTPSSAVPSDANITGTAGLQDQPTITALADGGFMIAWVDAVTGSIEGQRFSAAGAAIGEQLTLLSGGAFVAPDLALLDDGRFVVTAHAVDPLTSDEDVVSRIWDPRDVVINGTAADEAITSRIDGARINGLGGADTLFGGAAADTLVGGTGDDRMAGTGGDDTYFVDSAGDRIVEGAGQGSLDLVAASVTYTLGSGVEAEELRTTAGSSTVAINLTGNEFAQVLRGNAGVNILNGKGGADDMYGAGGNDTYFVDNAGDDVFEAVGGGMRDLVAVNLSYRLDAGVAVEELRTTSANGTTAMVLAGNEFAQVIRGNAGTNSLFGRGGSDTLIGGAGRDTFVFDAALGATNVDVIDDFVAAGSVDTIRVDRTFFTTLQVGALSTNAFHIGAVAADASDRIVYDSATGDLFYDRDGTGSAAAIRFAILDTGLAMTDADFVVVA